MITHVCLIASSMTAGKVGEIATHFRHRWDSSDRQNRTASWLLSSAWEPKRVNWRAIANMCGLYRRWLEMERKSIRTSQSTSSLNILHRSIPLIPLTCDEKIRHACFSPTASNVLNQVYCILFLYETVLWWKLSFIKAATPQFQSQLSLHRWWL